MKNYVVLFVVGLLLAGCGGGSSGDDAAADNTGTLNIAITDAAVDTVTEVWVEFTGVELKPASGRAITVEFELPNTINLLDLQNGKTAALLQNEVVPAGPYNWIRLGVNAEFDNVFDSYALLDDGSQVELRVPSGSQSGLKLVSGFTVTANQSTNIVLDWDLRKALSDPQGQPGLHLRPALRVTDMAVFGTLSGSVDPTLITADNCTNGELKDTGNAVYVYEGDVPEPLDIQGAETDPIATATVVQNEADDYVFEISYISTGTYSVAFTCQGAIDDPEVVDVIEFGSVVTGVTIADGETTDVTLTAPAM